MPGLGGTPTTAWPISKPPARAATIAIVAFFITGVAAIPVPAQEVVCSECHGDEPDHEAFAESVHAFLGCADCHIGAEEFPHPDGVAEADCSACHDDVITDYASSIHGTAVAAGEEDAPGCESCHGDVHTLAGSSEPTSPVHPANLPRTCGACHSDPEMVAKFGIPIATPIEAYLRSVHARATAEGGEAASCNDCHGSHAIQSAGNPASQVFFQNVPETCGTCHEEIAREFEASVHGRAVAHGVREAPVCTDCHGEHRILSVTSKESPVYATNLPKMTCERCHADLYLNEKYDLEADAVPSYEDSFHGLASRAGSTTVANCSSCHGVHDILPSSDPASHIHPANLSETCGTCHPGAGQRFAIGTVHVLPDQAEHALLYWVRLLYIWLIVGTIGGMVLHNLLDLYRKAKYGISRPPAGSVTPRLRMDRWFRVSHAMLIVSFLTLVYTGFALTYPESWWASPLLRWEDRFAFRGWIHRGAALLMLLALALHIVHLAMSRRARRCIAGMIPKMHDVTELRERILWLVGRRKESMPAPALGYPEKAEYLALMWGIALMTVTGFMLWFENPMLRLAPKWVIDVATAVHFYEAILASLAILVWHFYFVMFDPLVYPMDLAWLTGRESPGRTLERTESIVGEGPGTTEQAAKGGAETETRADGART